VIALGVFSVWVVGDWNAGLLWGVAAVALARVILALGGPWPQNNAVGDNEDSHSGSIFQEAAVAVCWYVKSFLHCCRRSTSDLRS